VVEARSMYDILVVGSERENYSGYKQTGKEQIVRMKLEEIAG